MAHTLEPGAIFDHGARTTEELAADVIRLALEHGWQDGDAVDLLAAVDADTVIATLPDTWQVMGYGRYDVAGALADAAFDASDSATDYLQDNHCPPGYWLGNDGERGAFGVWAHDDYFDRVDDAMAYLTTDGGRVPCSRYGHDSASCAPVAYAAACVVSAETGEPITLEHLDHMMSLVVNDHDDPATLLVAHGESNGFPPADYLEPAVIADADTFTD